MKRYLIAGLLAFFLVLVSTFPANLAYRWFAPPDIRLSGISGSIWSGSAAEGLAAGAYFRDLTWRLRPLALFSGKLAFETDSSPASGRLHTDVAVSLNGDITLAGLSGTLPLALIHPAFQRSGLSGDVSLQFNRLVLQNGLPVDALGSVTISGLFVPTLSAGALGDFRAEFQTTDGGVTGSLDDLSGVLDVAGVITVSPDRSYSLIGEVAARPGAPPSVEQQLQYLGSPNERGQRPFRFEGSL